MSPEISARHFNQNIDPSGLPCWLYFYAWQPGPAWKQRCNKYRGLANWTNISDGRVKKNIKANVPGLAFINKLKPVTYNLDLDAADKIIQHSSLTRADAKENQRSAEKLEERRRKEEVVYTGFVAQEVEKSRKN